MIDKKYCANSELLFENAIRKRLRRKNRRLWLLGTAATVFLCLAIIGKIWWSYVEAQAHLYPACEKVDIESLLHREKVRGDAGFTEAAYMDEGLQSVDYQLLYEQTGLGRTGVDYLFSIGQEKRLLELQENYFATVTVDCQSNTIVTREERIGQIFPNDNMIPRNRVYIPYVEAGDILITFNCHAFGWRNGHVGLVVDSERRLTLEASELGTQSKIVSMNHWERYPSFIVLRLKGTSKEARAEIAEFAEEYLVDIPYSLQAGMLERIGEKLKQEWIQGNELQVASPSIIEGTHCAHLVWYAYSQFGYNVDSDGGFITTPRDLYNSDLWEVVQVYGMSPAQEKSDL